jgi:pimeloyl-ACP methyl ester carboxylesterase
MLERHDPHHDEPELHRGSAVSGFVDLHYEARGRGPAVLLIMGLGLSLAGWWRTVPILTRHFRVIAFDNRGIGRSSRGSPWPYFVSRMADDAVAVLDAAGEERAHVYGISLGGMVAQELALRHPDRVRALVLGATTPGGAAAVPGEMSAVSFFSRTRTMGDEEAHWAAVPYMYSRRTRRRHAGRIGEDIAHRIESSSPSSLVTHIQQLTAAGTHDTAGRLPELTAPTLVVHGDEDVLVPPGNAELLAETIPGAEIHRWRNAGHFYVTDEPRADEDVARFLVAHTPEQPRGTRFLARARRLAARAIAGSRI